MGTMTIERRKPKIPRKPPTLEVMKRQVLRITEGSVVRTHSPLRNCCRSYCVSATGSGVAGLAFVSVAGGAVFEPFAAGGTGVTVGSVPGTAGSARREGAGGPYGSGAGI